MKMCNKWGIRCGEDGRILAFGNDHLSNGRESCEPMTRSRPFRGVPVVPVPVVPGTPGPGAGDPVRPRWDQ